MARADRATAVAQKPFGRWAVRALFPSRGRGSCCAPGGAAAGRGSAGAGGPQKPVGTAGAVAAASFRPALASRVDVAAGPEHLLRRQRQSTGQRSKGRSCGGTGREVGKAVAGVRRSVGLAAAASGSTRSGSSARRPRAFDPVGHGGDGAAAVAGQGRTIRPRVASYESWRAAPRNRPCRRCRPAPARRRARTAARAHEQARVRRRSPAFAHQGWPRRCPRGR